MGLFAEEMATYPFSTRNVNFRFESSGRMTDINISEPDGRHEGEPSVVVIAHGQGKQMLQHANEMYEMVVDYLCGTGLFIVLRPLFRDAQDNTAEGTYWKERMKETNELINKRRQLVECNDGLVGAVGHSYGTDSVMGCSGVVNEGKSTTTINPNLGAMMLLSPMVESSRQTVPDSFNGIVVPMLSITGTQDFVREPGEDAVAWRTQPHKSAPTNIERVKFIHRYGHDHAGAVGTPNEPALDDPQTAAGVCDSILAFACAHILAEGDVRTKAQKWLRNGATKWQLVLQDYEYCAVGDRASQ
jgi:hypothetical protein